MLNKIELFETYADTLIANKSPLNYQEIRRFQQLADDICNDKRTEKKLEKMKQQISLFKLHRKLQVLKNS